MTMHIVCALLAAFIHVPAVHVLVVAPQVQEDDTLCHIASCFKKRVEDVYQRNKALLKNPSRLYPGDRLRIS